MTTTEDAPRLSLAVIPIVGVSITTYLFYMMMPFVIGGFVDVLGYSPELAGRIAAVQLLAMAAANGVAAFTVHRWNLNRAIVVSCVLTVLSDFSASFVQDPSLMILTRIISGCAMGAALSAAYAAVAVLKNPTRIVAIILGGAYGQGILGSLIVPYLLKTTGMKGLFFWLALFSLVSFVLMLLWFPRHKGEATLAVDTQDLRPILLAGPVLMALIGFFLGPMVGGSMLYAYLERIGVHQGLSLENIGTTLAVCALIGLLCGLLAAWLAGKVSRTLVVTSNSLVWAATWLLFLFWGFPNYFAAVQIFGFTWVLIVSFVLGIFAEADASGRVVAVANVLYWFAAASGPALGSVLLGENDYISLIIVACAVVLVSVALLIPECRKEDLKQKRIGAAYSGT